MTTVQQLARSIYDAFQTRTRDNGERFVALKDGSPEIYTEIVRDCAHDGGRILPDDWRYQCVKDAVEIIAESETRDEAEERADGWQPDIYTADLLRWLLADLGRVADAEDEWRDGASDLPGAIACAQARAFRAIFALVLDRLEELEENEGED